MDNFHKSGRCPPPLKIKGDLRLRKGGHSQSFIIYMKSKKMLRKSVNNRNNEQGRRRRRIEKGIMKKNKTKKTTRGGAIVDTNHKIIKSAFYDALYNLKKKDNNIDNTPEILYLLKTYGLPKFSLIKTNKIHGLTLSGVALNVENILQQIENGRIQEDKQEKKDESNIFSISSNLN